MPSETVNLRTQKFMRNSTRSPPRAPTPDADEKADRDRQDLSHYLAALKTAMESNEERKRYHHKQGLGVAQLAWPLHMGFIATAAHVLEQSPRIVDERVYKSDYKALLDAIFPKSQGYWVEEQAPDDGIYGNLTKVDASVVYIVYNEVFPVLTVEFKDWSLYALPSAQNKADDQMRHRLAAAVLKCKAHYLDRIRYVFGISCFGDYVRFYRASWSANGYIDIVPGEEKRAMNPWSCRITHSKAVLRLMEIQSVIASQLQSEIIHARGRVEAWPVDHPNPDIPGKPHRTRDVTAVSKRIAIPDAPKTVTDWYTGSICDLGPEGPDDKEWGEWEYCYEQ